jgi:ABC-type branched-subunit amino acid transport system substrate-binding protein
VVGATLLGTNLWEDPALLSIGGVYVENALFPAALPLKDNLVSTPFAKFREKHRAVYGEEPDYLSAQAYDTLSFLLEVGRKWNVRDRFPLRQALMDSTGHEGVLGTLRFRPDGRLERDYPVFQVMNGDLVQVWP